MNATDPRTTHIEHLDFTPECDMRGNCEVNPGPDCHDPADYTVRLHNCGRPAGTPALFCATHLTNTTTWFHQQAGPTIRAYGAVACVKCRKPLKSIDDWMWDIKPLHK